MLERRTGDSRNDVGLSPGGIVRHADLEIGSFAGDISLYLAFAAAIPDGVVSFLVRSSGATSAELVLLLLLQLLLLLLLVVVNNRSSISLCFFGDFRQRKRERERVCICACVCFGSQRRSEMVYLWTLGEGKTVILRSCVCVCVCVFVTLCQKERERVRRS